MVCLTSFSISFPTPHPLLHSHTHTHTHTHTHPSLTPQVQKKDTSADDVLTFVDGTTVLYRLSDLVDTNQQSLIQRLIRLHGGKSVPLRSGLYALQVGVWVVLVVLAMILVMVV